MIDIFKVECIESHAVRRVGNQTAIERRAVQIVLHVFDFKRNIVCYARMPRIFLSDGNHPRIDIGSDNRMLFSGHHFLFRDFEFFVEHRLIVSFELLECEFPEHARCDIFGYQSRFYDDSPASAEEVVERFAEFPSG